MRAFFLFSFLGVFGFMFGSAGLPKYDKGAIERVTSYVNGLTSYVNEDDLEKVPEELHRKAVSK
jgi:hypothetical protein